MLSLETLEDYMEDRNEYGMTKEEVERSFRTSKQSDGMSLGVTLTIAILLTVIYYLA